MVVLFAVSQGMAWYWGRDVDTISFVAGPRKFEAHRDSDSGIWKVDAADEASLWFAFGYLQALDREFQTELVRLAARGEASRFFGEQVLKNDRLMRFSRRAAEAEFEASPDFVRSAAEAYVEGREALLSDPERMEPIEYQIMGVMRSTLPPWEASDVLAIARFHAWQLSFDVNLEQLYLKLAEKIGAEKASMLLPSESAKTQALYEQPRLYEGVSRAQALHRERSSAGLPEPRVFLPSKAQAEMPSVEKTGDKTASMLPAIPFGKSIPFDWGTQLALRGASNLWIIGDPRVGRELTLCNDAHLRFTWPSSLYPIRYEVASVARGTGFMLPGVPAMVIGSHENLREGAKQAQMSWGITLASYGDTQDLVLVDPALTTKFVNTVELYPVRDMQTGQIEVRRVPEAWTPYGPRVDRIFSDESKSLGRPVALDWLGYGQLPSPLEFFVRRNLFGAEGLVDDLHRRLPYPAVNFTWVEKNAEQKPKVGHLVTGWLRARSDRAKDGLRALRSEELASRRRSSQPRDRDYFLRSYEGRDPFFLVTANQKIWDGEAGATLAHSWEPDDRARAIVDAFDRNARDAAYSQTDYRAPQLAAFLHSERRRNSAARLCAEAPLRDSQCLELLAKLDAWDATLSPELWQPTLAALWHAYTKQDIFMAMVPEDLKAEMKASAKDWHRRSFSSGALQRILSDETTRLQWEKLSKRSLSQISLEAFRKALRILVELRGPETMLWSWGDFHRMDWLHPLVQAPEPWGTVFHDSLLGPRPGVPGGLDSPGRFEYSWSEDNPLDFPASHGAALRMCTEFKSDGSLAMRWSAPTGPSGNPFSKYAKTWSFRTFFKGLLSEVR
jgi:penicillin amidase